MFDEDDGTDDLLESPLSSDNLEEVEVDPPIDESQPCQKRPKLSPRYPGSIRFITMADETMGDVIQMKVDINMEKAEQAIKKEIGKKAKTVPNNHGNDNAQEGYRNCNTFRMGHSVMENAGRLKWKY
ncbi:hypothetical protein JTB14_001055 [Gonioctena quinquepunctata]|nr:hypothetical protein JTB14_001055 [Gonioctena quinquepunctata]